MGTPTTTALRTVAPVVSTLRPRLDDGAQTTVHVAAFPLEGLALRVVRLAHPETLVHWCARTRVPHAIVGGFFVRGPQHAAR